MSFDVYLGVSCLPVVCSMYIHLMYVGCRQCFRGVKESSVSKPLSRISIAFFQLSARCSESILLNTPFAM